MSTIPNSSNTIGILVAQREDALFMSLPSTHMFNFFQRKKKPPESAAKPEVKLPESIVGRVRETLFGDMPLKSWAAQRGGAPWSFFATAQEQIDAGKKDAAIATFKQVLDLEGIESRHYLQAWHALRGLGILPTPEQSKIVYGLVIEKGMIENFDLLATYADTSCRYYNFAGSCVINDKPVGDLLKTSENLIEASSMLVAWGLTKPSTEARRPPPARDLCRINFLTPAGIHSGEGRFDILVNDSNAGPILKGSTAMMQQLIQAATKR